MTRTIRGFIAYWLFMVLPLRDPRQPLWSKIIEWAGDWAYRKERRESDA